MARAACTFRKRDVTTALEAAKAAGLSIARCEIDRDGKIVIVAGKPANVAPDAPLSESDNDFGD